MPAIQDIAPLPKLSITGLENARLCVQAAVMYDDEGESYTVIAYPASRTLTTPGGQQT